jgi:hypothetical protein
MDGFCEYKISHEICPDGKIFYINLIFLYGKMPLSMSLAEHLDAAGGKPRYN